LRSPTQAEADRIAASCGTRVRRATMRGGLLRLTAWAEYEPVGATPAREACYYRRIRLLVARRCHRAANPSALSHCGHPHKVRLSQ
jgi:hypothetical protein